MRKSRPVTILDSDGVKRRYLLIQWGRICDIGYALVSPEDGDPNNYLVCRHIHNQGRDFYFHLPEEEARALAKHWPELTTTIAAVA